MGSSELQSCRVTGCSQAVLPALASEFLCLDHFLDQAFSRAGEVLDQCQHSQPLDPRTLDWLLAEGRRAVRVLAGEAGPVDAGHREKILELLLRLANLHEYVAHHSVRLTEPF
jgi:hypothetical protein